MIYFIKQGEHVKIGFTNSLKKRLHTLQVSSPVKLEVIGLVKGEKEDEKNYHNTFRHINSNGEWFLYTDEIKNFTDSLDKDLMWKHGFTDEKTTPIGLIKKARLENNLSMRELGEILGITKQSVHEMEIREMQGNITTKAIHKALKAMGYKYEARAK